MMIKFFGGSRPAAEAASYLTSALDAKRQEREEVQVLRGDPQQVAAVADSLEFEPQVHVWGDRLGAGGCADRGANQHGAG